MKKILKKIKQPILITGANGFIGSNLLKFLSDNNIKTNIIIKRNSNTLRIKEQIKKRKVSIFYANLNNHKKISNIINKIKPKTVFHLATYGSYSHQTNHKEIKNVNLDSSIHLLNECSKFRFEKFINTGSSSEYGYKVKKMKESDILKPDNHYGVFKASFTLFCKVKALNDNLPITTIRPFHVYGSGESNTRLIPTIINHLRQNKSPPLVSPNITRDMIYVLDVIYFYIQVAIKKNIRGEIFNIGSGKKYSIENIFNKIKKIMNSEVTPVWKTIKNRNHDKLIWHADMKKTKDIFNFKRSYSLDNGLKEMINQLLDKN